MQNNLNQIKHAMCMKRAIFPGTFDPFTIGHFSIVMRGLNIFDEIIIGIGVNFSKKNLFNEDDRKKMIEETFRNEPRVKVEIYNSLTIDFAKKSDAGFILRGLRTVADFEYERTIGDTNFELSGIETVILFTESAYSHISSTVIRDLIRYGKDVKKFLPPGIDILPSN